MVALNLVTLLVAAWPSFDPVGTIAWLDEGRLEVRGNNLEGVTVHWKSGNREGSDVCLEPHADGKMDRCSLTLGKGIPADPGSLVRHRGDRPFSVLCNRYDPYRAVSRERAQQRPFVELRHPVAAGAFDP